MTRMLPRAKFHSSKLIRCLASLGIADTVDAGDAFAEKLGSWIHFADAITLSAVHNDGNANVPDMRSCKRRDQQVAACAGAVAEFERLQALLADSIMKSCSRTPGKTHISLPAPQLALPLDLAAAYVPYRRFYETHQRDMEMRIQPLRVNLREAVAKSSAKLRRLAELDATFEKILHDRERQLLSKLPISLKKRFEELFKEHQKNLLATQQADNPVRWSQQDGWLARFCSDMQMLLLAEVEFRLQPALGLIEAFKQDTQ